MLPIYIWIIYKQSLLFQPLKQLCVIRFHNGRASNATEEVCSASSVKFYTVLSHFVASVASNMHAQCACIRNVHLPNSNLRKLLKTPTLIL